MKSRVIAILLCISCICTMTGCGSRAVSESVEASTSAQTAFGNAPAASPELAAQTQKPMEANDTDSAAAPEGEGQKDALHQQLAAAILCQQDGLNYDPEEPVYFWRAVDYLAGMTAPSALVEETEQTGVYRVTKENIQVFVQAMFADFAGEIPSVTEEDPVVSMGENGDYLIHAPTATITLTTLEVTPTADGAIVLTEAGRDGMLAGRYELKLKDYTGPTAGKTEFQYSIAGVEKQS